jgi:hypothetical protein
VKHFYGTEEEARGSVKAVRAIGKVYLIVHFTFREA